jgi:hypothetical protein
MPSRVTLFILHHPCCLEKAFAIAGNLLRGILHLPKSKFICILSGRFGTKTISGVATFP